jgi:hypothetical protein
MKKPIIILMSVLLLVLVAIIVWMANQQFNQWQDYQQLIESIQQRDEAAILALESFDTETQKQILQDGQVKKALVDFYLQQPERPILVQLETFDESVSSFILNDEQVFSTLKAYYFPQVEALIKEHHFDTALSLLETFKNKYPSNKELSLKYQEIEDLKQQRLAEFTQQYMECLNQTLAPLLERTHCMAAARRKIESVGIEHGLPNDPNLPAMYTEEIKHAMAEKNYEYAEQVLLDWQNLQPAANEQRQTLRDKLTLHRQAENIITDLTGTNKELIVKRLSQLKVDETLQQEILERPEVKKNLLQYHLNEALRLVTANDGQVDIAPKTALRLEQILTAAREGSASPASANSNPWYSDSTESPNEQIVALLQECQEHYEANRLTIGQPGTALACYRKVLRQYPGNSQAKKGLKAIENRYRRWAENALRQNRLDAAEKYLQGIKRVNPNSRILAQLKRRLNVAVREKQSSSSPPEVINEPSQSQQPVSETQPMTCEDCNCFELLKQKSIGIKPLTPGNRIIFKLSVVDDK